MVTWGIWLLLRFVLIDVLVTTSQLDYWSIVLVPILVPILRGWDLL